MSAEVEAELPLGLARAELRCFCQFVGWSRSGTTLVGALLDAHPEILIGQELDAAARVLEGAGREEILRGVVEREREFARSGRRWNGYAYDVHDVARADLSGVRVVGDKKAAGTTEAAMQEPDVLARLERVVGLPLRLLAVVRHPLDAIASLSAHLDTDLPPWHPPEGAPLDAALDWYLRLCAVVDEIAADRHRVHFVHLEHLAADPADALGGVIEFLGAAAPGEEYLARARDLIGPPRRAREDVAWTAGQRERVDEAIARHGFLAPYADRATA